MKALSLLLFAGLLFIQKSTAEESKDLTVSAKKNSDWVELKCSEGNWKLPNDSLVPNLEVPYNKDENLIWNCVGKDSKTTQVFVKVRTCNSCVELDTMTLIAVIVGNVVATGVIGLAVYSLSTQPKGKSFSGNKASDKVNLIHNGDGDMYQSLAPGQKSEYQTLGGARRK